MNRKHVKFLALAGMMMALSCGSLLCGNGIVSYEGETDGLPSATAEITPRSHCTSVEMPDLGSYTDSGQRYNCFTTYEIIQKDPHGTQLEFVRNPSTTTSDHIRQCGYQESYYILGIPRAGEYNCYPSTYYVRARCTTCNVVSFSSTMLVSGSLGTTCRYEPIEIKTTGMIYQNFDIGAPNVEWQHHAEKNETIYYSIAYNGFVVDDDVKVPGSWDFFPPKRDYTIDGVTFTVRVNSGYVAIKADETIACNDLDTAFAFAVG